MTTIYAAMENELLIVTEQNGGWRAYSKLAGQHLQCLAVAPEQPGPLYCGTFGEGLYKSVDGGESWHPVGEGISPGAVMAVATGSGGVVYAGTEPSALFRSEDGGESWRELPGLADLPSSSEWSFPPRPHTHHVRWIEPDPLDPERLYVCIEAGALVRGFDGGERWEDHNPDAPFDTHTLATHPGAPGRLYSAAGDGFYRPGNGYSESHDAGENWRRPDEGLSHHYLWGVAVDPSDPDTMVVSAAHSPRQAHDPQGAESAVFLRQGGEPWRMCDAGLPEPEGTLAPVLTATDRAEEFWALTNRGLYRTEDAGQNWGKPELDWPERLLSQHPQALAVVG